MKIIISPAKRMKEVYDSFIDCSTPCFLENTKAIRNKLKSLSSLELKELWNCNDKILNENISRLNNYDFLSPVTPAILAYDGIQYKNMNILAFTNDAWNYINNNLFILSAFYGVLKPTDGIIPYRLEMQSKLQLDSYKDLYDYWNKMLYNCVFKNDDTVINLASNEYSKCIEPYVKDNEKFITVIFGNKKNNKITVKATEAKMCRGLMVSYLANNNINNIEDIKKFNELDFKFSIEDSNENTYVFIKNI